MCSGISLTSRHSYAEAAARQGKHARAAAQVSERAQALEKLAFRLYSAIYSPAWHLAAPEKVDVAQQDLLHYQALTCIFLQVYMYLYYIYIYVYICIYIYNIDIDI
jgi:hypothetical protein